MSFTLIQETDFTAYRCCVCGDRVLVTDADIGVSSICNQCAEGCPYPSYIPIPWPEWSGDLKAEATHVNVRPKVGPWR